MSYLPRILTLDPTGTTQRLVRAVVELSEQAIIQTDVPTSEAALAELERSAYDVVVSALELYSDMDGMTLATQVQAALPETRFIVVGGADVESTFDERIVLLGRPLDPQAFLRVLIAAANGESMIPKTHTATMTVAAVDYGAVPTINLSGVSSIIETLMGDLSPLGLWLVTREGEVLLERGTDKQLDREQVAQALLPAMTTNIQMGMIVGGRIANMNFYDGDRYDVFALGIGYHHFLCLIFDGKFGAKQLGAVRTYALRAAQDIIALLGAQAFVVQAANTGKRARAGAKAARTTPVRARTEEVVAPLVPALETTDISSWNSTNDDQGGGGDEERERVMLDPIVDFDPSLLDQLNAFDAADADDLFDLDRVAEMAKDVGVGNLVSGDDAFRRGFVSE